MGYHNIIEPFGCENSMGVRRARSDILGLHPRIIGQDCFLGLTLSQQTDDQLYSIRMPRIIGLPPKIAGSLMILSSWVISSSDWCRRLVAGLRA